MRLYLYVTDPDGHTGSAYVDIYIFSPSADCPGQQRMRDEPGSWKVALRLVFFRRQADEIRPGSGLGADCALADRLPATLHLRFSLSLPSPLTKNPCLK